MSGKLKHTQLPWDLEDEDDSSYTMIGHYDSRGIMASVICRLHGIDDAEFIILACNAHYDMLDALKKVYDMNIPGLAQETIEAAVLKATGGMP